MTKILVYEEESCMIILSLEVDVHKQGSLLGAYDLLLRYGMRAIRERAERLSGPGFPVESFYQT